MLRLKRHRINALFPGNFHRFCDRLNCDYVLRCHFRLRLIFLGRGDVHDFNYVCFLTVFLNRSASKCHLYGTTPNLIIKLVSIAIQKIDVVGQRSNNLFLLPGLSSLCLDVLLNNFIDTFHYARHCLHTYWQNAFLCVKVNDRAVLHRECCTEFRMLSALRHPHHHILLLINLRNRIPCGL